MSSGAVSSGAVSPGAVSWGAEPRPPEPPPPGPSPATRGRDLAILNLTNTLPACVPPLLAALVPAGAGLGAVFVALALVAGAGGLTALTIRSER